MNGCTGSVTAVYASGHCYRRFGWTPASPPSGIDDASPDIRFATGVGRWRTGSFGASWSGKLPFPPPELFDRYRPEADARRSGRVSEQRTFRDERGRPVCVHVEVADLSPQPISAAGASFRSAVPASSSRKTTDRFNQKIDEQAHTQRKLVSKRVQDVNRLRDQRYLR